jgi:ubiquinone/menaquinone biosynthesis C-methylase UbiE
MKYSPELAKEYSNNREKYNETDRLLMETVESVDVEDKNVLDLGCGDGRHARLIKDIGAKTVTGIDISDDMIDIAKQNSQNTEGVFFNVATGEDLPLGDRTMDLVVSNFVMHYFKESEKVFKEISRVLKEKGFFIGTFNETEVKEGFDYLYNTEMPIRLGSGEESIVVKNLIKSKEEILEAISKSGLEVVKKTELNHPNAVVDDSYKFKDSLHKKAVMYILKKV